MSLAFQKLVGAGNDFIFLNASDVPDKKSYALLAKTLCDRHWGIGGDGLVVISIKDLKSGSFSWDFFNDDGSTAEMCGNAARCAFLYFKTNFGTTEGTLVTAAGVIRGKIMGSDIQVSWPLPSIQLKEVGVPLKSGKSIRGHFINTGVPHFVIDEELNETDCLLVQDHKEFAPQKTNVTLLLRKSDGHFFTQSFERGVKKYTLACGTGVIAAALVLYQKTGNVRQNLETSGGPLQVQIEGNTVHLIGSAQNVFVGSLAKEK